MPTCNSHLSIACKRCMHACVAVLHIWRAGTRQHMPMFGQGVQVDWTGPAYHSLPSKPVECCLS